MDFSNINWLGTLVASVLPFILGFFWYGRPLFGARWQREVGLKDEEMQNANMLRVLGVSFVWTFLGALVFGMFLGPHPGAGLGIGAGLLAGVFWVGGSFAINYQFEQKSVTLLLINAGYHTLQYLLYGAVFGLWP
jgi:hypothetical protein